MPIDYMDHCFERGRRYDFRKNKETDKVFWLDNGYHTDKYEGGEPADRIVAKTLNY